jgi:predicted metal-dependent HD superfamily phosphohydrolase
MNYHTLLQKVEEYVNLFFEEHIDTRLAFHNLSHTKYVAEAVKKIAAHYELDERSWFIVCTAAWFYDTGYLVSNKEAHELNSANLAESFLKNSGINEEEIAEIKKCILATKIPQQPVSLAEKIVCDAVLFYFGTDTFKEKNKLLRKEMEAFLNNKTDGNEWRAGTIKMLETHAYHTDYCRSLLDKSKADQLENLKSKQAQKLSETAGLETTVIKIQDNGGNASKHKKATKVIKKERPEKGIESMFRISATNNVRVSAMADNKAHIMITVNAIIISVILGFTARNINEIGNLLIPTIILLTVCLLTIIYALLATRPRISNGVFTPEQVEKKSVNLLYFGSYYKMNFKEYSEGVKAMMEDSDFLYGSLTKDIFWQGKVLGRKYRLLRIAYSIFMYGLIASVLAFAVTGFVNSL